MSDLDDRIRGVLQEIVAMAPDPPAFNAGVGSGRRPRPARALVAAAVVLVAVATAVAAHLVADRRSESVPVIVAPTPTTAVNGARLTGPGPAGFPAPLGAMQDSDASTDPARDGVDGVVVHLLVKAEQVRPGGTIRGHLQVINNTGHALRGGSVCRASVIGPVIFGGQFPERPVFVKGSCSQPFAFPVGTTTLPFALPVSYRSATGSHPLPTGYYHVAVVVRGPRIPVPAPLTVIVLDA